MMSASSMAYWPPLSVLLVVVLFSLVRCQDICSFQDGKPGEPGTPGRDGRAGAKGQKGEPVLPLDPRPGSSLKGPKGSKGSPGDMGPKGFAGDLGPEGHPGLRGERGPPGKAGLPSQQHRAAFSVTRNDTSYPLWNRPLTYTMAITSSSLINLNSGYFTCSTAGVYYFVFHSESKVGMCLYLKSDALPDRNLGFCDYNNRPTYSQVLSGGVVLDLLPGHKVWLEPFKDKLPDTVKDDKKEKKIVFNGFLLFPTKK
ncbi:hypothetical protein UPYG_G00130440 [Umbra pygmaea]|uniref:Complement C1q subcomponent subunit A n=1 Tax=Umbra pygmaea TaxID=75934 RepID=A0ABD0XAT1_UMBPY